jgi:hypothetical protein
MIQYNICPRFTFFGQLPGSSDKNHLAIVLNRKDEIVKYCYCTSKLRLHYLREAGHDCYEVSKEAMDKYFPGRSKETYIHISEDDFVNIFYITLCDNLNNSIYEAMQLFDEVLFSDLIEYIKTSDNLSERFKKAIIEFIG